VGLRGKTFDQTEFKTRINKIEKEAYYRERCHSIKNQVDIPVMMMGGIKTLTLMEEIIARNESEFGP